METPLKQIPEGKNMQAERALPEDIETLTELRIAYLQEDFGWLENFNIIKYSLPEYFNSHLNRDLFCYVLRDGDHIVSCAFLLVVEKPMSPAFPNGKTGIVLNVYTRPAFRQKGCARIVMKELIADAERMSLSKIELKSTDAGYHLYQSLGFSDDVSKYHFMKWSGTDEDRCHSGDVPER